jgi:poly-D-alanine transfer protein DltD
MTLHLINVLPNVWMSYISGVESITQNDISTISAKLKHFCEQKDIKKMIRLDKDLGYWNNIEKPYTQEIKKQMIDDEIQMLTTYYNTKINEIHSAYLSHNTTLIISSSKSLELSIGLLAFFMKKYGAMTIPQAIQSVNTKICAPLQFSSNMNRLFQMSMSMSDNL